MKKNYRELRVMPHASQALANGEAAAAGMADVAVNLREREQSLQVTGAPVAVGQVAAGDRLLTIVDGHLVTCRGRQVLLDGTHGVVAAGDIVGAHVIGPFVVIVTTAGLLYLLPDGDGWQRMDPGDAVPSLTVSATVSTVSADIDGVTFGEPYTQWRAPLADDDRNTLSSLLRTAWSALNNDARAEGYRTSPVLVRWALRLHDGSYLWMSAPQRVGDETLTNADRVSAVVDNDSSGFTGTQSTTMTLKRYLLDIAVERGVAAAWQPMVAGIDVLVTDEAQLVASSHSLDYRCLTRTIAPRDYVLEMGLPRRGADAIERQLHSSPWHLVGTVAATAAAGSHDIEAPVTALTLTAAQCAALARPMEVDDVVCSATAAGRLYCCTGSGDVVVSAPGNALVEQDRRSVLGVVPKAMAVVTSPLYSGGFGRYPVYVFSDDGIYAIPQGAKGGLGEARLVDRTVIADGVAPVEAGRDVWMVSRHGHLCRLRGALFEVCLRDARCRALAWCNAHSELWLLPPSGRPVARMDSGTMSERTVAAEQLYSDARHAVAVTADGTVLDLEQEQEATMPVAWRTHPIALDALMARPVRRVVWHVTGPEVSLTLRVTGQRGIMAQERDVSVTTVSGAVDQPLATPAVMVPARTVRLDMTGEARTGTLLLPTLLHV